jgi:hypothetical protein
LGAAHTHTSGIRKRSRLNLTAIESRRIILPAQIYSRSQTAP